MASMAITAYGSGVFQYAFGIFFKPISGEFGWSRAATAGAFSMSNLEGGIEGVVVGPLIDRLGPRKVIVAGTILMSLGLLLLSRIDSLLAFYVAYVLLMGIGYNAAFHDATIAAVANWFVRKRTLALGVLTCAFGLGGTIMAPITAWLLGQLGWRTTAAVLGIGIAAVCLPLAMVVRHKPERYGRLPDGDPSVPVDSLAGPALARQSVTGERDFTVREAMRTIVFWQLAVGFGLRTFGAGSVIVHQVPLLTDNGIDPQVAGVSMGLLGFMSLPGRLIFGYLGDRLPKRFLLTTTYVIQAASLFVLLTATTMEQVYAFTFIYGLGWGASPLMMSIRGEYFGRKNYATIAGFQQAIIMIGGVSGPVLVGWIFDISGSYQWAISICAAAMLAGGLLHFFARPPKPPRLVGAAGEGHHHS